MGHVRGILVALLVPLAAVATQAADGTAGLATPAAQVAAAEPVSDVAAKPLPAGDVKSDPIISAPADVAKPVAVQTEPATESIQVTTPAAPIIAPAAEPAKAADAGPEPYSLAAELGDRLSREKSTNTAREDRDAVQKFYEARKGAPLWVTETGLTANATALVAEIGKAGDYGLDAAAFKLPDQLSWNASNSELANAEATISLAALKYARQARGGRVDPQALSVAIDRKAQLLAPAKVLEQLAASDKPDVTLRGFQPQNPQFELLRQKWLAVRAGQQVLDAAPADVAVVAETPKSKKPAAAAPAAKPLSPEALERKLLVNMEMWRWMPVLGNHYIQPNIPEFLVRVVKDGHVIHSERIVTGQPDKMTPIFSDEMRIVVFKPFWNVPESIKYKEMMPQLLRGASLAKSGYKADINGRPVDTGSIDWREVDMREVHIYQPPGEANALGKVKFLFPNKHDVYLHDTPSKSLFNASSRAFSHGCVRVRDPLKLAEVLLGADKGWTRAQVEQQANNGPENTEIKLTTPVPIHLTYFTAWVDADGKLQTAKDVYGHENRVQLGLEGKVSQIVQQPRQERYAAPTFEDRRRYAEQKRQKHDPVGNWLKNLFN